MIQLPDEWEYYESINALGESEVMLVNLQFQDQDMIRARHEWLILLLVEHQHLDRIGGVAGAQRLIKTVLERAVHLQYVARTDRRNASEFWMYLDRSYDPTADLRSSFGPGPKFFSNVRHDPNWTAYFQHLLPQTPSQFQQVLNGKTFKELRRRGDDSERSHTLRHRIKFRDVEGFSKCKAILEKHGFAAENVYQSGGVAVIFRQMLPKLSLVAVNEATINLVALADRFHGKYDGWETEALRRE